MTGLVGIFLGLMLIAAAFYLCASIIWIIVSVISKRDKKRPIISLVVSAVISIFLIFANGYINPVATTEDDLKNVRNEADKYYSDIISDMEEDYQNLLAEKESIQAKYDSYKESMSEYEGLSAAEAESRRIQAESIAESEQVAKEQEEKESLAAKEAEEKAGYETGITYEQLARTPDDFEGEKVKFTGKVVQLIEGDSSNSIRFAVDSDYGDMLYCEYDKSIVSSRILENDIITIYGTSYGLYSYQSTIGGKITIPAVIIDKIDQ